MKKIDTQEILEAIQGLGQRIDGVEVSLGQRIDSVETRLGKRIDGVEVSLGQRIDGVEVSLGQRIDELHAAMDAFSTETDKRFTRIEAIMVTKDYLDVKLADQRSDIVMNVKKKIPEWVKIGS
ncbi:MAG TPA: hypothetical protein VN397_02050 [Candidatus Methylomirabilis sp.]|nr:hypothetical protein [Candidatus Methylomirabilis sp.]